MKIARVALFVVAAFLCAGSALFAQEAKKELPKFKQNALKMWLSPSNQINNIGFGDYHSEKERMNEVADVVEPILKKQGIKVFKGAELRFDESENDYLFYGWKNDILSDPEDVFRMGIANFAPIAKAEGCLIIQAHPYRRGCTPAIACYLDGVEVINTSPRHESYNERAAEYAEQFGLIATSGSDCHRPEDVARGGIITSKVPSDSMEMMRLIRSRDFELIGK